jgi:hypothetical protein
LSKLYSWLCIGVAVLVASVIGVVFSHPSKQPTSTSSPEPLEFHQPTGAELSPAAVQFARAFQAVVNEATDQAKLTKFISHVSCVQGGTTGFFCAYLLGGVCRVAELDHSTPEIQVLQAGKVDLAVPDCGALKALRLIGSQQLG